MSDVFSTETEDRDFSCLILNTDGTGDIACQSVLSCGLCIPLSLYRDSQESAYDEERDLISKFRSVTEDGRNIHHDMGS